MTTFYGHRNAEMTIPIGSVQAGSRDVSVTLEMTLSGEFRTRLTVASEERIEIAWLDEYELQQFEAIMRDVRRTMIDIRDQAQPVSHSSSARPAAARRPMALSAPPQSPQVVSPGVIAGAAVGIICAFVLLLVSIVAAQ